MPETVQLGTWEQFLKRSNWQGELQTFGATPELVLT
jgi:hypothetical protein